MEVSVTTPKVARLFLPVKSTTSDNVLSPPNSMIHHKDFLSTNTIIYKIKGKRIPKPYGVSRSRWVLTPSLLIRKYDYVRDCFKYVLSLKTAQREVILRLLRLWAYYGSVYPKESQITELPGCSKATYWRTIRKLKELGLIYVVNRYLMRPKSQISNLYRFDKLLIILARYLAEHGTAFGEKWLTPVLAMPGSKFWSFLQPSPRKTLFYNFRTQTALGKGLSPLEESS